MGYELLTPTELADQLRVDTRTLARWRSGETGPAYVRVGKSIRYEQSVVSDWLGSTRSSRLDTEKENSTKTFRIFWEYKRRGYDEVESSSLVKAIADFEEDGLYTVEFAGELV